jgi:hypothetical protein
MMHLPFRRLPPSRPGDAAAQRTPPSPAQRQWMARVLLSTLSPDVSETLYPWLLVPTDPQRWPPPDTISARLLPLRREEYWDQPPEVASWLLRQELRAILQTLDLPLEAISGLTRNGRLVVHAMRLRQLEWRLWPRFTARAIRRLIA